MTFYTATLPTTWTGTAECSVVSIPSETSLCTTRDSTTRYCETCCASTGAALSCLTDCSTVREWYADCRIVEVEWQYTLGQGETRIGKNRLDKGTTSYVKDSHELLIIKDA